MRKFSPDVRNFGGRKVISDQFRNHYGNLANIQPTLKTRLPTSLSTHRKVLQKSFDSNFHITKVNKSLLSEHLLNIKHMKRRINSIGSVIFTQYNERKKNPFDPITHPVVFFRNGNEGDDPTLDQKFITKSVKPPKLSSIYAEVKEKRSDASLEIQIEVPCIEPSEPKPLELLKAEILKIIVKNRIYKESDIQELFKYTKEANSHLDPAIVAKALDQAYSELNS